MEWLGGPDGSFKETPGIHKTGEGTCALAQSPAGVVADTTASSSSESRIFSGWKSVFP